MSKIFAYVKNLFTYFSASIIPMVLSLVANPWIAKNMSPQDYAISGFYLSFSSLIGPVIAFYLVNYYTKEYFRLDDDRRQRLYAFIAKATIWFSGLASLLCFAVLGLYLHFFKADLSFPISPYMAMAVFSLPLTGLLNLQLSQFKMDKKATAYFRLATSNSLLNLSLTLLFVVFIKWGAFGKLLAPLSCNLTVFLYLLIRYRKTIMIKTPVREYRKVFVFCLPLAASAMLGYFTSGFPTTYLERLGNINEYGNYVVGVSMATYLTTFTTAVSNTFKPDLFESTVKRQWKRFAACCGIQIGSFAAIAAIFIILAPFVISLLTAGRYTGATPYARILALTCITSGIYYLTVDFAIVTNRPRLYLYTSILGSIVIVLAMPLFVGKWDFIGGAWMAVISYLILSVINILLLMLRVYPSKKG